ncbi:MAG: entericidin A/B family lipoprotein [Thioalkalivibrionaceae bacterium]
MRIGKDSGRTLALRGAGLWIGTTALLVILFGGGVVGCSTTAGLGQDIQRGGEAIERAADRNR